MTLPIRNTLFEWNTIVSICKKELYSSRLIPRVRKIYEECKEDKKIYRNLLASHVSLNKRFEKVESKIYSLFLRSIQKEMQADCIAPIGIHYSYYNILMHLAYHLYEGDDSETAKLVRQLPENIRSILFRNLWVVLGKPTSSCKVWEYAFLNTNGYTATANDKYTAIISALSEEFQPLLLASGGHTEALRDLLSYEGQLSQTVLSRTVIHAAEYGRIDTLRFLLSQGIRLMHLALDRAACLAISNGHIGVLPILLSDRRKLSEQGLDEAAKLAAEYGYIEAFSALLPDERQLTETGLGEATASAARNGHFDIVRLLLKRSALSQKWLDQAVIDAARSDHVEMLEFFLSGRQLSPEGGNQLASEAASNGFVRVLEFLVSRRELSERRLCDAVFSAAAEGQVSALRFLLSDGRQLSQQELDRSVVNAAAEGQIGALRFLLSDGRQLSDQSLHHSVTWAARNGHIEALRFLLSEGRQISGELRDQFVLDASSRGHFAIVEFLLMTGPIGASCRDSSFTLASGERRDNIRDILRVAQIRPEDAFVQRASISVQWGSNRSEPMLISLEFIKQDPKAFLESLAAALPPSFSLAESPQTIDLGGVSKQVYATLFASLLEKRCLSLDAQGLACIELDSSLPIYHTLGAFYSRFFEKNKDRHDPFLTGHVFSSAFFALVKIMVEDPSDDASLLAQLASMKEDQRPFFALLQDKANTALRDQVIQMMTDNYLQEEGDAVEFAEGIFRSYKNPILALIQGASEGGVSDPFFSKLRTHAPEEFTEALQGQAISKELVLGSLEISNEGGDPFREKIEWLKNKICNADEAWLRKFVLALTGRDVLAANTKLQLRPTWRAGVVFELHTCFNSLDLPHIEMNQEDFLAGLEYALNNTEFNTA